MCGIFGILNCGENIHNVNIHKLIIDALNLLKNRGYDSCGIFLSDGINEFVEKFGVDGNYIKTLDEKKDIFEIMEEKVNKIDEIGIKYDLGMGHTRWATHGGKTDENSHPHFSNNKRIKLVHNGIISNYNDLKEKYLKNYIFNSSTDTEVIANMIQYLKSLGNHDDMENLLSELSNLLEGTWACIIYDSDYPDRLYFMKNENPLLIGKNDDIIMFTSEPSGFMNKVSKYILLREKTYGYIDTSGNIKINGKFKELDLIKLFDDDINLPNNYSHWMYKEIYDQTKLNVLVNPITNKLRYSQSSVLFDFDFIKPCKYLYIIGCGSSYYAGLIASNYFRYTRAFEFVNVFDGGEFTKAHLEAIGDPESNLLVLLISQSGETRDLNIATTICREFSSNRKNVLEPNYLLKKNESIESLVECDKFSTDGEIKIIGIINVIGSLISRRTIDNIYTNCGRENAVASTKSCTSQILACLLLAIYKSELNGNLNKILKDKFLNDLSRLETDIMQIISSGSQIEKIASNILEKKKSSIFLLGKDELHGSALEGALKIKEIAYLHAEGFGITSLKHGPYALIETDTPIIVIYKDRDHFVKSIVEEIKTRGAFVIEISPNANPDSNPDINSNTNTFTNSINSYVLPSNKTFTGLLAVIVLQLLSYYLSVKQGINPDRPRNLAKVVTVD
jgi:glucosamine--fructose-6-phosphate aminotransferase (isomerizing)